MFGNGDPYQQQAPWAEGPGPLGNIGNEIASVMNAQGDGHVYVPTGPGNPVLRIPIPQRQQACAPAQYVPPLPPKRWEDMPRGARVVRAILWYAFLAGALAGVGWFIWALAVTLIH